MINNTFVLIFNSLGHEFLLWQIRSDMSLISAMADKQQGALEQKLLVGAPRKLLFPLLEFLLWQIDILGSLGRDMNFCYGR